MDKATPSPSLRAPRGEAVAPLAAPTGRPMASAGRSPLLASGASPLGARSFRHLSAPAVAAPAIGSPEAPCAGVSASEGAEPPSRAPSSAPLDLDTQIGLSRPWRRLTTDGDGCESGEVGGAGGQ